MPSSNDGSERSYPLGVPGWDAIPHLVYGFLGRSRALPPGDFRRPELARALGTAGEDPVQILAARQVHGNAVLTPQDLEVSCEDATAVMPAALPAGDAIVTASADVILTVRTADCVPILLVAPRARAVAAVHAGWRGLVAGIVRTAMTALADRYEATPDEVRAAIGPAIGGCCYEFGTDHHPAFAAAFGPAGEAAWLRPRAGRDRPHLDLRLLARVALAQTGIAEEAIHVVGPCTAEHPAELHSYRRDGADAGRQLSYIGWRVS